MTQTVTPDQDFDQNSVEIARGRRKRGRNSLLKTGDSTEVGELSATELAFAFFAWLVAFIAFCQGLFLAWAYFS